MEADPTCFGLQKKPSSGSHSQCLATRKITRLVQCWYRRCQCYGDIVWPVWRVCCALCKRI